MISGASEVQDHQGAMEDPTSGIKGRGEPALQPAVYPPEQQSWNGFRSHVVNATIDARVIRLWYCDCLGAIEARPFVLAAEFGNFVAMIIGMGR